MPAFGPIKRTQLIFYLRRAGFEGPMSRRKHQFMVKGDIQVPLPNPHQGDISRGLLALILRQADMSRREWEQL